MKRIIFIAILFTIIFSCEDMNEEFCWECITSNYDYYLDINNEPTLKHYNDSTIICERTEFEMLLHEKNRTVHPYSITTGGTHLKWKVCLCTKIK